MHKERLEQMVVVLRSLPPEKFDISDWQCGTSACAVGHACTSPVFKEQGLGLRYDFDGITPTYGVHYGWSAVEEFFELGMRDAEHLFYVSEYSNRALTKPSEVADRIEAFLTA